MYKIISTHHENYTHRNLDQTIRSIEEFLYHLFSREVPCKVNPKKGFESYMLHFEGGCTLEIMSRTDVDQVRNSEDREFIGFAHLAFSTGSKDQVDRLTERLRQAGYKVIGEPRTTGDGFYESVILDPDNNRIEISA